MIASLTAFLSVAVVTDTAKAQTATGPLRGNVNADFGLGPSNVTFTRPNTATQTTTQRPVQRNVQTNTRRNSNTETNRTRRTPVTQQRNLNVGWLTGTWKSSHGDVALQMTPSGGIRGVTYYSNGTRGYFQGAFNGRTITLTWWNARDRGTATLALDQSGRRLNGQWVNGAGRRGAWNLAR